MMDAELVALIALLAGAAALGVISLSLLRINRRLRRALNRTTDRLENLQLSFQRFVPQDVVESVIDRGVSAHGERRAVSVLFADLVGFTSLSETMPPESVVRILNGYFRAMSRVVREHNGFVVRFLGDGILAIFGAPEPNPWHTHDAARAALAMLQALDEYGERLRSGGDRPLYMGIGIDTGNVMAGVIGSDELMEYTVIGDVVNTASRIEELTRSLEYELLVTERFAAELDSRYRLERLDAVPVKGKSDPIRPVALLDVDDDAHAPGG